MNTSIEFPDDWHDFLKLNQFIDSKEVYTNGIELIPVFRVEQLIEHLLKEQEAVEPEVEVLNEIDRLYRCPRCHKHFFYEKQKYCDQCGQAVKWE